MSPGSAASSTYVHGYTAPEQRRLIAQAEFWRDSLILDGTDIPPGARLLDVGCGVGAVLRILGEAFPGAILSGIDVEAAQIDFAGEYLSGCGVAADLRVADARELPYESSSFDHVWMMWTLEHMGEEGALAALREARRVLVPGGTITCIEVDYATIKAGSPTPALKSTLTAIGEAMRAFGQSDAGTQLWGWLDEAGFSNIDPGERLFSFRHPEVAPWARYLADVVEATVSDIASVATTADEETLRRGVGELRAGTAHSIRCAIHKARATSGGTAGAPASPH
jgi:ubiquinone/menaquinone biosynthesis C-methylase UbiE